MSAGSTRRKSRSDATSRKAQALPLLVAGMGYAEVAKSVGCAQRTVRGYMEDPEFRAEVERERAKVSASAADVADALRAADVADAVERQVVLTKIIRGELEDFSNNPVGNRIKAVEVLGKMQGDFVDKSEVTHKGGGITVVLTDEQSQELAKETSG